ncbi:glycerol-3-phosphate dehydrogenase/oxidase [Streptomyces sp. SID8352]|uniref:glycerol-3-phosphate dehydrogenase/oxidase n=1 Tax=Streptomyces sp. SID8352 TaxID=2690338 RepID=UPI00136FB065|nr:glycerol-3-phosphate dehydrogenase/oxidase [Streptomyces sp. SID8352]MYU21258.1 FAD-dependent oxidoreductase [Streptomyces sp. SID8352]
MNPSTTAVQPGHAGRLGPDEHRAAWERLAGGNVDVLIVGGGVTGAGAALDAATRGLSTALVEARDLASGTSSRSSKLFHGGLRYLEQLELPLVREALRERELMLTRIAPHLVEPVSFLYPLRHRGWERLYFGAGLALYDTLGGRSTLPRHRHLTRAGARRLCRSLKPSALVGGVVYHDAQTDDARHTMTVARTAAAHGAVVRSSTEVVDLLREDDRVVGAVLRDSDTGDTCRLRARVVLNCTGVWNDEVQRLTGERGGFSVRASKGVHLVVPQDRIDSGTGLILRTENSVLFVIPWRGRWVIGTTDTDWRLDRAHPAATSADIDYVLGQVNKVLAVPLTRDDVLGVYAGLRPLLSAGEGTSTAKLSREHAVHRSVPGLVSVAGGKYTTYRVMARDAIDACAPDLVRGAAGRLAPSVTAEVPLLGAVGYRAMARRTSELAAELGVPETRVSHLLRRYGTMSHTVLAPAADDPTLLEPLEGALDYLRAEVRYAATHEAALHLDDVLTRRTRISVETAHRGIDSAADAAALVAPVLGWDDATAAREVEAYRARVESERASQEEPDDAGANAARLAAPGLRRTWAPAHG